MYLVLCSKDDVSAIWAYQGFKARCSENVELVSADLLVYNMRCMHRLSNGSSITNISLADGRTIKSSSIKGALNRISTIPWNYASSVNPDDSEYAFQETKAFFMSWLYGLPGQILNRPSSRGLCGRWLHDSEWVLLASQAGLPHAPYRQSINDISTDINLNLYGLSRKCVIIINGKAFGDKAPAHIIDGSKRLAKLSGMEIVGVYFSEISPNKWIFSGATPLPDLRKGGDRLLDTLIEYFLCGRKKS